MRVRSTSIPRFAGSIVLVLALVACLLAVSCASDSGVTAGSVQTKTYRNASLRFDYPSEWSASADEPVDPQDRSVSLIVVGSADAQELVLVYFRPGSLPPRDYLRDVADIHAEKWAPRGTWALLTSKFREAFKYGGVDSGLVRLSDDGPAEFIGTAISAPGADGSPDNAAFIVYKRNTTARRERLMGSSNPEGVIGQTGLSAYAGNIPNRQLILTSFTFLHAAEKPKPTLAGQWNGVGTWIDILSDGRYTKMLHANIDILEAGRYEIRGNGRIALFPGRSPSRTCDYSLTRDELTGRDVLVLCGIRYDR